MDQQVSLVERVREDPALVFTDEVSFDAFYAEIEKEALALVADVSTEAGRKAVRSMAYKVVRTKTAIDDAGKALNEEFRRRINTVDAARRRMRQKLDDLASDVREPVDAWEREEEARAARRKAVLGEIDGMAALPFGVSSVEIRRRIDSLEGMDLSDAVLGEYGILARQKRGTAIHGLTVALDAAERAEAERAELERRRAEDEARRQQEEAAARARREEEERQRREAIEAERGRLAAEAARLEEERARLEAERREQETRDAEERRRREAEERARQEEERRAASTRIRNRVIREIAQAILALPDDGNAGPTAASIAKAIVAGRIPHVTVKF